MIKIYLIILLSILKYVLPFLLDKNFIFPLLTLEPNNNNIINNNTNNYSNNRPYCSNYPYIIKNTHHITPNNYFFCFCNALNDKLQLSSYLQKDSSSIYKSPVSTKGDTPSLNIGFSILKQGLLI